MATELARMQQRRDTALAWTANNPVLSAGEIGFEIDTGKFKIGDGSTAWSSLAYAVPADVDPAGVSSFNTRTGAVTLSKADVTGTGLSLSDLGAAVTDRGAWASSTAYNVHDLVRYGDTDWVCSIAHTSTTTFDDTKFTELNQFRGAWQATTRYEIGDVVVQAGALYSANATFTSAGSFNATNWTALSGGSGASYSPTGVVFVDQAQGNDATGNLAGKPFATFAAAYVAAPSGARIEIADATYNETPRVDSKPVHVYAKSIPNNPSHGVIFKAPSLTADCCQVLGTVSNVDGTIFENVTFQGFSTSWNAHVIRGAKANSVKFINCAVRNSDGSASQTTGGIGAAIAHGERWVFTSWLGAQTRINLRPGIESVQHSFSLGGGGSNNYQELINDYYETLRANIASGISDHSVTGASIASLPIDHSGNLQQTAGLGILESEGLYWPASPSGGSGGTIANVQRAIVCYLVGGLGTGTPASIQVAPLSQGNYSATNQATTIPSSGSVVIEPGTANAETVAYTSLFNIGNGLYQLQGITRGDSTKTHADKSACQDVALASAVAHASGLPVIQSYGTTGLAGLVGGACYFQGLKAVNPIGVAGSDNVIDIYGGNHLFEQVDFAESGPATPIRIRPGAANNRWTRPTFASATTVTDDGTGNKYDSPSGGTLIFSPLSSRCAVEHNYNTTNPTSVIDNGNGNDPSFGTRKFGHGDGAPLWYPPSSTLVLPYRAIGRRVAVLPDDTLDAQWITEDDVLRANAQLNGLGAPTWSMAEATGQPFLYRSNGLTWVRFGSVTNSAALLIPLGGLVAADEWVMEFFIRPRGRDFQAIAAAGGNNQQFVTFGAASFQVFTLTLLNSSGGTYGLKAVMQYYDVATALTASWTAWLNGTLVPGDFLADMATPVCVSYDQTNGLLLTAGQSNKSATGTLANSPTVSKLLPWDGDAYSGGALALGGGASTFDVGYDISIPVFGRYSNAANLFGPDAGASAGTLPATPGASWRFRPRPKLTLNAQAAASTWPTNIGGIVMANSPQDATLTSNHLAALGAAKCPLIRLAECDDQATYSTAYATISNLATLTSSTATQRANGGGGAIGGTAIGINWANFDQAVLDILNQGINIHAQIGYIPTALQAAGARFKMPSSTANFALWASAIYGRYKYLESQATGGGKIVDCTFWNEPEATSEWNDTPANFYTLYLASTQQINADQAAAGNNGVWLATSDHALYSGANPASPTGLTFLTGLLDAANAAVPRPAITSLHYHDYSGSMMQIRKNAKLYASAASAHGYPGLPLRCTEWDAVHQTQPSFPPNVGPQAGVERTSDVYQAVASYAQIVEWLAEGLDMTAFFQANSIVSSNWNAGYYGSIFDSNANSSQINGDTTSTGKPTMVLMMYEMLWKHHAGLTNPQTRAIIHGGGSGVPWPNLRGLLTTGTNAAGKTVVTITYGSYRHVGGTPSAKCRVDFEHTLPAGMTVASWKHWGISDNLRGIGRLPVRAQDNGATAGATLPIQDLIDWESVHCLQIVGA